MRTRSAYRSGASSSNDRPSRPGQNLKVQPKTPAVDVFEIQTDPLVEFADLIASADLPDARDARLYAQLALVPELVAFELVRTGGTGPHQAHVPLQHAPELR